MPYLLIVAPTHDSNIAICKLLGRAKADNRENALSKFSERTHAMTLPAPKICNGGMHRYLFACEGVLDNKIARDEM